MSDFSPLVIESGLTRQAAAGDVIACPDLTISGKKPLRVIDTNTTYYVATTGNDTTGDGSSGNPWATLAKALSYLSGFVVASTATVTINAAAGVYTSTSPVSLSHTTGQRINITGAAYLTRSLSSVVSSSGAAYGWELILQLDSVAGITAGQYLLVRVVSGGTLPTSVCGCHKIDSVDAVNNRVTVSTRNSASTAPSGAVSASVYVLSTVFSFTGCSGLQVDGGQFGSVTGVVLEGDRTNSTFGVLVRYQGGITLTAYNGINGFAYGVLGQYGAAITMTYAIISNCKSAGVYLLNQAQAIATGAVVTCNNNGVGTGAGFICYSNSFLNCGGGTSVGNGVAGIYADGLCMVDATGVLISEHATGVNCRQGSYVGISGSATVTNCSSYGLYAILNACILANGVSLSGNGTDASPAAGAEGNYDSFIQY